MKILHIIPNLRKGGAERLTTDIVRELAKRECIEVRLVVFQDEIAYDIDDIRHLVNIIPASVELSIRHKIRYQIDELQKFLEDFQPDIIHSHLFEAEIISRSCFFSNARWFSHSHDRMKSLNNIKFKELINKKKLTDYFEKKYLFMRYKKNGGNQYIAISKDIEFYLNSVVPKNIVAIHLMENAIETNRFKTIPIDEKKLIGIPFKLISVGRLDANKNHKFLLDCIKNLKDKGFQFHLTIVGEGNQRIILENKIEKLNLQQEVTLSGVRDNVEELYRSSDLYVHSSRSEGFGLTLIEAMATGLPVITLDGGGNRDVIEEGKNGFLIAEENVEIFTEKILELVNNLTLYKDISQYAQSFAQKYDIVPYVDNLLKLYRNESVCAE
jgi:glycosyltransferase involved in cell wall biosynthesis